MTSATIKSRFPQVSTLRREKAALERENRHLRSELRRLERLAYLDPLTGLGNRRHLDIVARSELSRAVRSGTALTLLSCDVDRFKDWNDRYGHDAGDALLVEIGRVLKRFCRRGGDLAVRYGGDEFALLLPGISRDDAGPFADRLRGAVTSVSLSIPPATAAARVSISIGGVTFQAREARPLGKLLEAADAALYRAKQAGRDRARFAA